MVAGVLQAEGPSRTNKLGGGASPDSQKHESEGLGAGTGCAMCLSGTKSDAAQLN